MLNTILSTLIKKKTDMIEGNSKACYVISFVTLKGGVGKTTLSYELIQQLAHGENKVLAFDLDPQANLTLALTEMDFDAIEQQTSLFEVLTDKINPLNAIIRTKSNVDLLPSNSLNSLINQSQDIRLTERMSHVMQLLASKYNYIIIDSGPTTSVSHALAVANSDLVLTPVTLDAFSLQGLHKTTLDIRSICKAYSHKILHKVIFNKIKPDPQVAELAEKVRESLDENLWLTSISEWTNYSTDPYSEKTVQQIKAEIAPIIDFLKTQQISNTKRLSL